MYINEYKIFDLDENENEEFIEATKDKGKDCCYDIGYVFSDLLTHKKTSKNQRKDLYI